jgi:hypothetical protein
LYRAAAPAADLAITGMRCSAKQTTSGNTMHERVPLVI